MDELGTIDCPACGKPIPLEQHGRNIIARHDCLGLPMRNVYDAHPPTQAELDRAERADLVVGDEVAAPAAKKGKK